MFLFFRAVPLRGLTFKEIELSVVFQQLLEPFLEEQMHSDQTTQIISYPNLSDLSPLANHNFALIDYENEEEKINEHKAIAHMDLATIKLLMTEISEIGSQDSDIDNHIVLRSNEANIIVPRYDEANITVPRSDEVITIVPRSDVVITIVPRSADVGTIKRDEKGELNKLFNLVGRKQPFVKI